MVLISLMAAMAQLGAEPETAICRLELAGDTIQRRYRIEDVSFSCPQSVKEPEALAAYAQAVLDQGRWPVRIGRDPLTLIRTTFLFEYTETGWQLQRPTSFVYTRAAFPRQATRQGIEARCFSRFTIMPDGRTEDVDMSCEAFDYLTSEPHRGAGNFEAVMRRAVQRWRWLTPVGTEPYCDTMTTLHLLGRENRPRAWLDEEPEPGSEAAENAQEPLSCGEEQ